MSGVTATGLASDAGATTWITSRGDRECPLKSTVARNRTVMPGFRKDARAVPETSIRDTPARTLGEVIEGADVFLGLSAGGVLKPEMVRSMAARPIVFASFGILPEDVRRDVERARDHDEPGKVAGRSLRPGIERIAIGKRCHLFERGCKQMRLAKSAEPRDHQPQPRLLGARDRPRRSARVLRGRRGSMLARDGRDPPAPLLPTPLSQG